MGHIRKNAGRPKQWEARHRGPDGRERSRSFERKTDAQRWLAVQAADVARGAWIDPAAGKVTFRAHAERWLAAQTFDASTRERTESRLRVHLLPAFSALELRAIRPSTIQAWLGQATRDLAPSHVRLLLANLSAILGAAVEDGILARNPCASRAVQAPAVPAARVVPWTAEQVRLAADAMLPRYRATVAVAAGCGLRQGETFGLAVPHIDFLRRRLDVRQQVKHLRGQGAVIAPPKRGKTRTVPLPDTVAYALAEHLRMYSPGEGGLVFTNEAGNPINRGSYNDRLWKPAVAAAGLPAGRENGFHALRHHFASVLLSGGVSIRALADYLGHTDPGFTLRVYAHLMPADDERMRAVVDAALAAAAGQTRDAGEGR